MTLTSQLFLLSNVVFANQIFSDKVIFMRGFYFNMFNSTCINWPSFCNIVEASLQLICMPLIWSTFLISGILGTTEVSVNPTYLGLSMCSGTILLGVVMSGYTLLYTPKRFLKHFNQLCNFPIK